MSGKKRFHNIYWRQFTLTAGMVLLTLLLLGTSFFALTYTYIMNEKKDELLEKAVMMAELSATYSKDYPLYSPIFGGENQGIRIIAQVASSLSDIDFLIWDTQSNALLTTDNRLEGREISLPARITDRVLGGDSYSGMTTLNIYPNSKYVVAVPIYAVGSGSIQGMEIGRAHV